MSTAQRPVLALDIDGVLALDNPQVPVVRRTVKRIRKWRRDLLIPVDAPRILRRLAEDFDCVWASAWAHTAHPALRDALSLPQPPWPWIGVQFNKASAVRDFAAGRPWVLIDDGTDVLGGHPLPDPAGLTVHVRPDLGIAEVDPGRLLAAVRGCRAPRAASRCPAQRIVPIVSLWPENGVSALCEAVDGFRLA